MASRPPCYTSDMNLYNAFVPPEPRLELLPGSEGESPSLCLDMKSEQILQNQRQFAYTIGGPAIVLAGAKVQKEEPIFGAFVMALGIACSVWHYKAYQKVRYYTGLL
jgi:hypothetical protein